MPIENIHLYLIRSVQPAKHDIGKMVEFVDLVAASSVEEARTHLPNLDIIVEPTEIRQATVADLIAFVEQHMKEGRVTVSERTI